MNKYKLIKLAFVGFLIFSTSSIFSQEENSTQKSRFGSDIRAKNVVSLAAGASVINGDYVDPLFEIYSHVGYKRFLSKHFNINIGYHKFNLAYEDLFNEGYMSFDMNLEFLLMPDRTFSPFVFAGGGLNAANYFERIDSKIQGGVGIEYMVTERIGMKLMADYNYMFVDDIDGLVAGEADDVYWRMAFGLNLYFGNRKNKKRIKDNEPTVINSNPIIHHNN